MGLDIDLVRIIDHEVDELCHLFVEEQPELFLLFQNYIRRKHFIYPDEEYDSEVYFYTELAYQRKGVIPAFYTDFTNDVCLTKQSQIAYLSDYIDAEHRTDFHTFFVNQFVEGQTVIIIGW
ncbi:MAG: hypothetical protein ACRYFZ_06620 [Janthinobacterium lividum]